MTTILENEFAKTLPKTLSKKIIPLANKINYTKAKNNLKILNMRPGLKTISTFQSFLPVRVYSANTYQKCWQNEL